MTEEIQRLFDRLGKHQGVRIRGDKGNFQLTPYGDEAIRGAKPLPDLENSRTEHFQHGRTVKTAPPTGAFTPPVVSPRHCGQRTTTRLKPIGDRLMEGASEMTPGWAAVDSPL